MSANRHRQAMAVRAAENSALYFFCTYMHISVIVSEKNKKKSTEFGVHISQFYNTQAKALDAINKYTKFHYRASSSF